MTTNVPAITWSNGSPVLPAESAILAGVQADQSQAFGGGQNMDLRTPQGQLAQSQTAIIGDKNNQIAYIANMLNPATSQGQWQDAIAALYFMTRIPAAGTVVTATCTGAVNTPIPAGSQVQDTNGYTYASTAAAVIGSAGTAQVQFQNLTTGPIACAAGALSKIVSAIPGWDTITNAYAGSLGNDVESPQAFELRRQQSVAKNSVNSVQSILGEVLSVPDVIDAYVVDNPTGAAISYGSTNYTIAANSVVVSVAGGASAAIAQAIWSKKSLGCSYNGNTSYAVQDTSYSEPYPTYTVTWLTPTATPAFFAVTLKNNAALPSNIVSLVQAAILASFSGQDGGPKARINQTTVAGRYYANVAAIDPSVQIESILMGLSSGGATLTALTFGIDQLPTLDATNVAVTLA